MRPARNTPAKKGDHDLLRRDLDCAVLNFGLGNLDELEDGRPYYQTVRGVFVEGKRAYPGAAIRTKTHVQIAVRDESCILGYFMPTSYADEEESA